MAIFRILEMGESPLLSTWSFNTSACSCREEEKKERRGTRDARRTSVRMDEDIMVLAVKSLCQKIPFSGAAPSARCSATQRSGMHGEMAERSKAPD
jgi:hypothetical protein